MVKFLIFLGVLFIIFLTVIIRIKKKINKFFQNFAPKQESSKPIEEILYNKDDIVVLKGDAQTKK